MSSPPLGTEMKVFPVVKLTIVGAEHILGNQKGMRDLLFLTRGGLKGSPRWLKMFHAVWLETGVSYKLEELKGSWKQVTQFTPWVAWRDRNETLPRIVHGGAKYHQIPP